MVSGRCPGLTSSRCSSFEGIADGSNVGSIAGAAEGSKVGSADGSSVDATDSYVDGDSVDGDGLGAIVGLQINSIKLKQPRSRFQTMKYKAIT